jgi:peptidoglycan hydrolase-like protein with peptidoglycan-binding domain
MRYLAWAVLFLLLSCAWGQELSQPQVRQAQEKLRALGFEVGAAEDGLDPRTLKALQAFQRTRRLAVTGELDAATLHALGLAAGSTEVDAGTTSPPLPTSSPWRPVLEYLRFYDSQPARLILHVTAHFRGDMPPAAWIAHLMTDPATRGRSRLTWQIDKIETGNATATVYVRSQVRVNGVQQPRLEAFSLVRSPDSQWLIDAWHSHDTSE